MPWYIHELLPSDSPLCWHRLCRHSSSCHLSTMTFVFYWCHQSPTRWGRYPHLDLTYLSPTSPPLGFFPHHWIQYFHLAHIGGSSAPLPFPLRYVMLSAVIHTKNAMQHPSLRSIITTALSSTHCNVRLYLSVFV